jgi:hypothetical protein
MELLTRTWLGRLAVLLLAFAVAGGAANAPASPPPVVSTEAVQAAFILNLTRFVTWPESAFASADAALVIGTFPRDAINGELDAGAHDEVVNNHPVRTLRIQSLDDLAKCHVIFVPQNNARRAAILQQVARKPILAIGEGDDFLGLGGHVRFVPQPPRIGLRISVENLRASGLEARAQLLRFAAAP